MREGAKTKHHSNIFHTCIEKKSSSQKQNNTKTILIRTFSCTQLFFGSASHLVLFVFFYIFMIGQSVLLFSLCGCCCWVAMVTILSRHTLPPFVCVAGRVRPCQSPTSPSLSWRTFFWFTYFDVRLRLFSFVCKFQQWKLHGHFSFFAVFNFFFKHYLTIWAAGSSEKIEHHIFFLFTI